MPSCVTVTKDAAVWDAAVADWKAQHNMGFLVAVAGDHGANALGDASLAALDASKAQRYGTDRGAGRRLTLNLK